MHKPSIDQRLQSWLAIAKENILCAKSALNSEVAPYHTICFLGQEGARKYLIAYFCANNQKFEKDDNLKQLVENAYGFDNDFALFFPLATILSDYIETGFYPSGLSFDAIGKNEATEAIEAAEKIEQFVLEKLKNFLESQ